MNISCNWLKSYVNFDFSIEKLEKILTMLGIEVDSYEIQSEKYKNFFVAEVIEKNPHPNADKLAICKINTSSAELLQVVCGAPNVAAGQKVVLGISGAVVPINGMQLENREIRGEKSEGMLCSQAELKLGEDNSGIWVLPEDAKVGLPLVEYLKIDDIILEISLTPNKSDCASHLGIAREISAYLRKSLAAPNCENLKKDLEKYSEKTENINEILQINVENRELCPRYAARVVKNVKNCESPEWLKNALQKVRIRPKNVVVDVTNWVLMDCGQPLHAFDFDKISGREINVKNGFQNYEFTTLDGKKRQLNEEMLMICDEEKPIAAAGVMGGENSEITENTTNVVIESAYFNPISVRKTAKKFGISTDASYRFERGTDLEIVLYALEKAAIMIAELTGGQIVDDFIDIYPEKHKNLHLDFSFSKARKIIGIEIAEEEILNIFESLGLTILKLEKDKVQLEIPHRRNDIFSEIDLVEEVARLINYDNIPANFSVNIDLQSKKLSKKMSPFPVRNKLRNYLSNIGLNEILTYNIIEPSSAALFLENPITIANPLGEEMSKMRPSMLTQMLKTIAFNINQGSANLQLFEIGKVFLPQNNANSFIEGIDEREHLVIALAGNSAPHQWAVTERKFDFYDIKGIAEEIFTFLKVKNAEFLVEQAGEPLTCFEDESLAGEINILDSKIMNNNSANIIINNIVIGIVGEISKNILKKYDLEVPVFAAVIDLENLSEILEKMSHPKFEKNSQYPVMSRDLAFVIDCKFSAAEIQKIMLENSSNLLKSIEVFDVYQGKNITPGFRSIAFSLTFSSDKKTLTDAEIEADISKIILSVEEKFAAKIRAN